MKVSCSRCCCFITAVRCILAVCFFIRCVGLIFNAVFYHGVFGEITFILREWRFSGWVFGVLSQCVRCLRFFCFFNEGVIIVILCVIFVALVMMTLFSRILLISSYVSMLFVAITESVPVFIRSLFAAIWLLSDISHSATRRISTNFCNLTLFTAIFYLKFSVIILFDYAISRLCFFHLIVSLFTLVFILLIIFSTR